MIPLVGTLLKEAVPELDGIAKGPRTSVPIFPGLQG